MGKPTGNSSNILTELPAIEVRVTLKTTMGDIGDIVPDSWWHGEYQDKLVVSKTQLFTWLSSTEGKKALSQLVEDLIDASDLYSNVVSLPSVSVPTLGWSHTE